MIATDEMNSVKAPHLPGRWPQLAAAIWICATMAGMWLLWRYAATAGSAAAAPACWPGDGLVKLNTDGPTLVMFAHPHCPCTRASVAELDRMLAKCPVHVKTWIVFYKPSSAEQGWERTALWDSAEAIAGVKAVCDVDGAEAGRFDATTSGQTLLYDADGRLRFSGGITAARGHEGDNIGKSAILETLNQGSTSIEKTPVYGCSIKPCIASP